MTGYGALQSGSNDAGSWQLIEQVEPGEWAPLARGGKQNIIKLAAALNGPAETAAAPADAPGPITRDEVLSWSERDYMAARERLWQEYRGAGGLRVPYYFDGQHGREYTTPAGELMTGSAHEFTRAKQRLQPTLGTTGMQLTRLADAARAVVATWYENPATDLAREWPAMAQLQRLLDENERQP